MIIIEGGTIMKNGSSFFKRAVQLVIMIVAVIAVIIIGWKVIYGQYGNDAQHGKEVAQKSESVMDSNISKLLSQLQSDDKSVRDLAKHNIIIQRQQSIQSLQRIITDQSTRGDKQETVSIAISLLGELRADEAVQLLVDQLTFQHFRKHLQSDEDLYPSVGALINIGLQSIQPLLHKVENTDDKTIHILSGYVIYKVLGMPYATMYVDKYKQQQIDPVKKRRLGLLINEIRILKQRNEMLR